MAEKNKGKITQVISAVLDIKFPDGHLPEILNAITIDRGNGEILTAEVSQHLGDDTLFALVDGVVKFERKGRDKKQVSVYPVESNN